MQDHSEFLTRVSLKRSCLKNFKEKVMDLEDSSWDSTTVSDLAKHFSDSLHAYFYNAIRKICEKGHSKETAEATVLKCGPFYGIKDMESSIVDLALDCLDNKRCNTWYTFEDLNSLVEFMILEMVTMLKYVKPSLSVHEAMWTLLICDLNVLVASESDIDPLKFSIHGLQPIQEESTSSKTQTDTVLPSQDQETVGLNDTKPPSKPCRNQSTDGNCECCKKWYIRDTLRRKTYCFERQFKGKMTRKAIKAEISSLGKLYLGKKQSPSGSSSVNKENQKETKVTTPKPETVTPEPCKTADYYLAGIPYDESKSEHVPRDDKDKMILTAVGQLESLQKEAKSWDDWAIVKVMQVAKRLSQDRPEIKKLKAEKMEEEKMKKDKEAMKESTKKKLTEVTAALTTTDCQLKMSSSTIARLESENSVLKREKEREENRSLIVAKSLEEAQFKELEALKKSELCGSEKNLLEEDLKSLKQEVGPKQRDLEKAKHLLKETEKRLAHEEREAARFLEQAESIRKERERLEALAEAGADIAIKRAGKEFRFYITQIKRIQYEIAALNLEEETKKIAELTRMGWQLSEGTSRPKNSDTHHECVMCLTEEMTVLFIPCGHQVLCAECNVIHEDNGMKECPSCRTPIQKRINCSFAKS